MATGTSLDKKGPGIGTEAGKDPISGLPRVASIGDVMRGVSCAASLLLDPNPDMVPTGKLINALGPVTAQVAMRLLNQVANGDKSYNDGSSMPPALKHLLSHTLALDEKSPNFTVEASDKLMSSEPWRIGPIFNAEEARKLVKILEGQGLAEKAACQSS